MRRALLLVLLLAVAAQAQTDTVNSLYKWYLKGKQPKTFAPVKDLFEPAFYARLEALWHANEVYHQNLVDFDPVLGSQIGADSHKVLGMKRSGDEALVVVRLHTDRGENYQQGVVLRQFGGRWLITDWYSPNGRISRTSKIFTEIERDVEQARQALKPDTAVRGMLESWTASRDFKSWWEENRGRFTFACQDDVEASGMPDGWKGAFTLETPVVAGKKADVSVRFGDRVVSVGLEKDEFGWRISQVERPGP